MAMNKDNVINQFFDSLDLRYPDFERTAEAEESLRTLIDLIIQEVRNGDITINITNTTGLTAGGYPVIGTVTNAGDGSIN